MLTPAELAQRGLWLFPLRENSKLPAIKKFTENASRDPQVLAAWRDKGYINMGIATSIYMDNRALIVIDVDVKNGKDGDASLQAIIDSGRALPATYTQYTTTGGRHIVYACDKQYKQGVNVLGDGLDIRASGGCIVATGSYLDAERYTDNGLPIVDAPDWLLEALTERDTSPKDSVAPVTDINMSLARKNAIEWLKTAPEGIAATNRSSNGYLVACKLKDYGISESEIPYLMLLHWYDGCGLDIVALAEFARSAYAYGDKAPASAAIEAQFEPTEVPIDAPKSPLQRMIDTYALINIRGKVRVLLDSEDASGRTTIDLMTVNDFDNLTASEYIVSGNKNIPLSREWLKSKDKRVYHGLTFAPGMDAGRAYNLWRGFSVTPLDKSIEPSAQARRGVDMFMEHLRDNICNGDQSLYQWVLAWFANLVQSPHSKPSTALVFRGKKGTGKTCVVNHIGRLIRNYYAITADRRYLSSNFNAIYEQLLLICFDEALWSGDKQSEGKLKNLITGDLHMIERKGIEVYSAPSLTRVCIIGNEDWLVPATSDERRYVVLDVGDGRKQDTKFFEEMKKCMDNGGYAYLLRTLLDVSVGEVNLNAAPATKALEDQKLLSLDSMAQWFFACLDDGDVILGDTLEDTTRSVAYRALLADYRQYERDNATRAMSLTDYQFSKRMDEYMGSKKATFRMGTKTCKGYTIPNIDYIRARFCELHGVGNIFD